MVTDFRRVKIFGYRCKRVKRLPAKLMHEFERAVKQDGRINLQREGELHWFLSVRYTYDKVTGATGCNQEAYIDSLLVKYGMTNANACKLPLKPESDLDSLPNPDVLDKIVIHTYAALIGELLYIAINTVPQLRYLMSSLTRYMSKATPAHLACTRRCSDISLASNGDSPHGVVAGSLASYTR